MHRRSPGRQEEDLVSNLAPGMSIILGLLAPFSVGFRDFCRAQPGCIGSVAWLWGQEEHRRQV